MKLFLCKECNDIQKMRIDEIVYCVCGEAWGYYKAEPTIIKDFEDDKDLAIWEDVKAGGQARVFGISNQAFKLAQKGVLVTFQGWFYDTGFVETDSIEYVKGGNNDKD